MVNNHEDYYQGCVMHMIQQWRRTLGKAKDMKGHVRSLLEITFELQSELDGQYDDMLHMDAIKYMGEVIAEKLGRMYGLQIYYYRKPVTPTGHNGWVGLGPLGPLRLVSLSLVLVMVRCCIVCIVAVFRPFGP